MRAQPALRRAYALFKGVSSRVCEASGAGVNRRGRVMVAAAARVPLRRKVRVSSASRLTCGPARAPSGSEWLCPRPALRSRRAGVAAGPGGVERVPVQGGTQHGSWWPAPARRGKSRGDGGQRFGDPRAGVRRRQGHFIAAYAAACSSQLIVVGSRGPGRWLSGAGHRRHRPLPADRSDHSRGADGARCGGHRRQPVRGGSRRPS
jgi:hypothetical protein